MRKDGVACVVLCVACMQPSIYLVCVVFGTAIPTSSTLLENAFHTCLCALLLYQATIQEVIGL